MKPKSSFFPRCVFVFAVGCCATPVWPQQLLRALDGNWNGPVSSRIDTQPEEPSTSAVDQNTRTFKVNPNAFVGALGETIRSGKAVRDKDIQERVRDYFTAAGIERASDNTPRLFFNDRTGVLMVQGRLEQLERVEQVVQALTMEGARVAIEVRMVETDETGSKSPLAALQTKLGRENLDMASALPLQTASRYVSIPAVRALVLTEGEFVSLLRSAEQVEGVDILTMPRAVTLSGRQARMTIEEPHDVITDPPFHAGRKFRFNAE